MHYMPKISRTNSTSWKVNAPFVCKFTVT